MSRAYPGDVVYFHKSGAPVSGKVLSAGKHGCTVEHDGQQHKVKWEHVSGHKSRAPQKYAVIDHGEDGMIVQNQHGHRRFLAIPQEGRSEHLALAKATTDSGRIVGDKYEMPLDDAIREHEELVDALQSPTKTDDQEQINEQGAELEKMKRRRKLLAMKKA